MSTSSKQIIQCVCGVNIAELVPGYNEGRINVLTEIAPVKVAHAGLCVDLSHGCGAHQWIHVNVAENCPDEILRDKAGIPIRLSPYMVGIEDVTAKFVPFSEGLDAVSAMDDMRRRLDEEFNEFDRLMSGE